MLFSGSYTTDDGGTGCGIGAISTSPLSSAGTAAVAGSPSFLAWHPAEPVLYAALEHDGTVAAFRRTGPALLEQVGAPVRVGPRVCHLAVSPDGSCLIASCFGDGSIVVVAIGPRGVLGAARRATVEGASSRAHAALFLADGDVAVTEFGLDEVRFFGWHGSALHLKHAVEVGSGPRHLAQAPDGAVYVASELSCSVSALRKAADRGWEVADECPIGRPGVDLPAEISHLAGPNVLHVTVRGSDSVATLSLAQGGLHLSATTATGGVWPRHHLVVDGTIYVANQRSDSVTALAIAPLSGIPSQAHASAAVPTPTCLVA